MLNRAPSVYVPVEPDDDGIALPTFLSILVHGSILAFIVFSHHVPTLDTQTTIETSIVTPEELADMQAAIIANRGALANSGDEIDSSRGETTALPNDTLETDEDRRSVKNNNSIQNNSADEGTATQIFRRTVSVFTKSDEPAEEFELPANNGYDEEIGKDRQEFEDAQAAFQRQLDKEMTQKQRVAEEFLADQNTSAASDDQKSKPSINSINNTNKSNTSKSSNGKPLANSGSNTSSGKSSGKSKGQIIGELKAEILPRWNPPQSELGKKITAYITVDEQGNVKKITTNLPNTPLEASLVEAIKNSSPLEPVQGSGYFDIESSFTVTKK